LGKAGLPIDQKSWFRDEFFGSVTWIPTTMRTGNVKEQAIIPFEVFIAGRSEGIVDMRVDHAVNRIAAQNNAPTWLNWSGLLQAIRSTDFTGWYLVLERLSGRFRLHLSRTAPTSG
jgi:hypothetical protein